MKRTVRWRRQQVLHRQRHLHAILDVLLAKCSQGRVAQRSGDDLAGKGHVFGRLLDGQSHACMARQPQQQVTRDEAAHQQRADGCRSLLDALALVRRHVLDLRDRQAELRADLRHQSRQQRRVGSPVDAGQRHGARGSRQQRLARQQAPAALHRRDQVGVAFGKFDGGGHECFSLSAAVGVMRFRPPVPRVDPTVPASVPRAC